MALRKQTWIWIAVAAAGTAVLGFVAIVAAGVFLVARQMETEPASSASAERAFAEARARFEGQKPLIQIEDRDGLIRTRIDRPAPDVPAGPMPEAMHVMAYDPEEGRIVRLSLPFWLLRLGNRGSLRFSSDSTRLSFEHLNLTVDDLTRYGPALLVDQKMPEGERVLIWTR
jgi:hypothetical protein